MTPGVFSFSVVFATPYPRAKIETQRTFPSFSECFLADFFVPVNETFLGIFPRPVPDLCFLDRVVRSYLDCLANLLGSPCFLTSLFSPPHPSGRAAFQCFRQERLLPAWLVNEERAPPFIWPPRSDDDVQRANISSLIDILGDLPELELCRVPIGSELLFFR